MPIKSKHPDMEFNIKWWRLHNNTENGFRREELDTCSAITITGFSDAERKDVKAFCDRFGGLRISATKTFDEDVSNDRIRKIPNSDGVSSFHYTEREFGVFGSEEGIYALEGYLCDYKPRLLETFVHGLADRDMRRICDGCNHRVINGMDIISGEVMTIISIGDRTPYLELFLRSPQGIDR